MERDDLVVLANLPDVTLAGMYAELLRRASIRCLVQPQGAGYGGWGASGFVPHRLLVTQNTYETARSLLTDTFGEDYLTFADGAV
ncbi:MAG: DUF2007 domain-containing protein [Chloroflexota bacterium]|nr:DUF2007 domain-containing protein [Chloroflexota bacterium]